MLTITSTSFDFCHHHPSISSILLRYDVSDIDSNIDSSIDIDIISVDRF
jgi:hypothetical protein